MTMTFRISHHLLWGICLATTAMTAQAQYSYAELDVHAPSVDSSLSLRPCVLGEPTTMNATGDAMGTATVRSGTVFDWSKLRIVPAYKSVVLKWPGTASGLVKPVVVSTTVSPLFMNNQGSWAGYIHNKINQTRCQTGMGEYQTDKPAVQIGTTVTRLIYGPNGINFEVRGINNKNWVLGTALDVVGNRKGLVWKAGTFTELESGGAQLVFPAGINDNGDVAGYVMPSSDPEKREMHAALWVGNKLVWQGPAHSKALAINALGDVLWKQMDADGARIATIYLRAGGVDTPVPMSGALSSRRTLIGSAQQYPDYPAGRLAVWAAGNLTWLLDDMRLQGVTLPCGPLSTNDYCDRSTLIEQTETEGRKLLVSRTGVSTPRPSGKRYYRINGLP